jgi:hypothetical protein
MNDLIEKAKRIDFTRLINQTSPALSMKKQMKQVSGSAKACCLIWHCAEAPAPL